MKHISHQSTDKACSIVYKCALWACGTCAITVFLFCSAKVSEKQNIHSFSLVPVILCTLWLSSPYGLAALFLFVARSGKKKYAVVILAISLIAVVCIGGFGMHVMLADRRIGGNWISDADLVFFLMPPFQSFILIVTAIIAWLCSRWFEPRVRSQQSSAVPTEKSIREFG